MSTSYEALVRAASIVAHDLQMLIDQKQLQLDATPEQFTTLIASRRAEVHRLRGIHDLLKTELDQIKPASGWLRYWVAAAAFVAGSMMTGATEEVGSEIVHRIIDHAAEIELSNNNAQAMVERLENEGAQVHLWEVDLGDGAMGTYAALIVESSGRGLAPSPSGVFIQVTPEDAVRALAQHAADVDGEVARLSRSLSGKNDVIAIDSGHMLGRLTEAEPISLSR